jgi:intracellular multiplication protein IcmK
MKKYVLAVAMLVGFCANVAFADTNANGAAPNDFQSQLQNIQQSMGKGAHQPQSQQLQPQSQPSLAPLSPSFSQVQPEVEQPLVVSGPATAAAQYSPATRAPEDPLRSQAFDNVTRNILPLSPSQIEILRNMYDDTQRAAAVYPGVPPRPTSSSVSVNLSPGSSPPVIRLSAGFVTSLVFVDSTGAPWPIEAYSLGNPTAFNIQWDKKSNILLIQAISAHRVGNIAVILRGLNTPVMLNLSPGQPAMDVRVDIRVPGLGPDARPSFEGLPGTESPVLLSLLDGIPPPGAKPLKASDCEDCVWLLGDKLYLRTQFTVISPGWLSTLSSADGTHVYEMQPTPLILASYNGKTIKLKIEGF